MQQMKKIIIFLLILSIGGALFQSYLKREGKHKALQEYQQQLAHYNKIIDLSNSDAFNTSLDDLKKLIKISAESLNKADWSDIEVHSFDDSISQKINEFYEIMCNQSEDKVKVYDHPIFETKMQLHQEVIRITEKINNQEVRYMRARHALAYSDMVDKAVKNRENFDEVKCK
jgi:hypothetical protein